MNERQPTRFFERFTWAVPSGFADPLAACKFERGDVLYDSRRAYEPNWDEALKHISCSLQVKAPKAQTGGQKKKEEKSVFTDNWKSEVKFSLIDHKTTTANQVTTTQGRLYVLLWKGDLKAIDPDSPDPEIPSLAMEMRDRLPQVVGKIKEVAPELDKCGIVVLMPHDLSWEILRRKFRRVEQALETFGPRISLVAPEEVGLGPEQGTEFVPTANIACFGLADDVKEPVEEALKSVLYQGKGNQESGEDWFRLAAHGHLASFN